MYNHNKQKKPKLTYRFCMKFNEIYKKLFNNEIKIKWETVEQNLKITNKKKERKCFNLIDNQLFNININPQVYFSLKTKQGKENCNSNWFIVSLKPKLKKCMKWKKILFLFLMMRKCSRYNLNMKKCIAKAKTTPK